MRTISVRKSVVIMLLACLANGLPVSAADNQQVHPLAVHMSHWLVGSREWSTPNPDHDVTNPRSFAEYRVRWDWGPFHQQLLGKLFGVRADGSTMLFWNLYSSYNPASDTVVYQQIGLSGAYIHGEHPRRHEALAFGEVERLDTTMATPDGKSRLTRHENVFEEGAHHADVYEQDENGEWTLANQWDWILVAEADILGRKF